MSKENINNIFIPNAIRRELAFRELSRRKIEYFTSYTYPNYMMTDFHKTYCRIMQYFVDGKIKKLIVSMPPQHGKSEISTRRLPALLLGHNPARKVAVVSYSSQKAWKFGRDIKLVMSTKEYQALFPYTKLPEKKNAIYSNSAEVVDIPAPNNEKGNLFLVGRGGGLTGDPVDFFLMDDIYKDYAEACSPIIRQNVIDFYDTVAETRLHNDSQQLIVFTRWSHLDLIGYIEKHNDVVTLTHWAQLENPDTKKWYKINFEALMTGLKNEIDPREIGEPLFPERHSKEKLESVKNRLMATSPEKWTSLYQGDPKPLHGLLYPEGLKEYSVLPDIERKRICYIDVADSGSDYLCAIFAVVGGDNYIYVLDVEYTQEFGDELENRIAGKLKRLNIHECYNESNAGGAGFSRNISKALKLIAGTTEMKPFHQSGNKESRVITNASNVVNHILMPQNWVGKYSLFAEHTLTFKKLFKSNAHDDNADTLTGLYEKSGLAKNEEDFGLGSA